MRDVVSSVFGRILRWFIGWSTITTPAIIPSVEVALPGSQVGPYQVEWIADSGAGRNLTSAKALAQQGIYNFTSAQADPAKFATGNGHFTSSEVVRTVGSCFGESSSYLMADCPVVSSMGELVNHHGRPFVWLPNSLPFFLSDSNSVISDQFGNVQMNTSNAIFASRLDGNVPVFTEMVEFAAWWSSFLAEPSVEPAEHPPGDLPSVEPAEHPPDDVPGPPAAPEVAADDEHEDEEPASREARLIRDAASLEHRLAHFPKNPACKVCSQARMYARRATKSREDPLHAVVHFPQPSHLANGLLPT